MVCLTPRPVDLHSQDTLLQHHAVECALLSTAPYHKEPDSSPIMQQLVASQTLVEAMISNLHF